MVLDDEKVEEVVFSTSDDGQYYASPDREKVFFEGSKKYVCFSVQARDNAHIGLFPRLLEEGGPVDVEQEPFYEIVFGTNGNKLSTIRRGREGEDLAVKKGPMISVKEFRELWVSVDTETGEIAAGKGDNIKAGKEMSWKDKEVLTPLSFAFMSTEGAPGGWKFKEPPPPKDAKPSGPLPPYELTAAVEPDLGSVIKRDGLLMYQTGPPRTGAGVLLVGDLCGWQSGRTRAVADYLGRVLCALVVVPCLLDSPCLDGGTHGDGVPMGLDLDKHRVELRSFMMKYVWDSFKPKIESVAAHMRNGGVNRIGFVGMCFGSWIGAYTAPIIGDLVCAVHMYPSLWLIEEDINRGSVPKITQKLAKLPTLLMTAGNSPDPVDMYKPGGEVFEAVKAQHGKQAEHEAFPRMPHGWVVRAHHEDEVVKQGAERAVLQAAKYLRKFLWPAPKGANAESLRCKCREGDTDAVELLLASGLPPGGKDVEDLLGLQPLHYVASSENSVQAIASLVEWQADVNASGGIGGETPLHVASRLGKTKAVKLLLENRADPEVLDKASQVPLHLAAKAGSAQVCLELLKKKADINARDTAEQTALHLAAIFGKEGVVQLLLSFNMDVDPIDIRIKTPQQRATEHKFDAVANILEAERQKREEEEFFRAAEAAKAAGVAPPEPPAGKDAAAGAKPGGPPPPLGR